jgi:hypothetical protein
LAKKSFPVAKHSHFGFHLSILSSAYDAMVSERTLFCDAFTIGNKKLLYGRDTLGLAWCAPIISFREDYFT